MLFLKPHELTRWRGSEDVAASTYVARGVYYSDPVTLSGQVLPMTAAAAMERTGVEVSRPHELLWDSEDSVLPRDLLSLGGRWFCAIGAMEDYTAEPVTAHRRIVIEEIDADGVAEAHSNL